MKINMKLNGKKVPDRFIHTYGVDTRFTARGEAEVEVTLSYNGQKVVLTDRKATFSADETGETWLNLTSDMLNIIEE